VKEPNYIDFEAVTVRNPERARTLLGVDLAITAAIADVLMFINSLCYPPLGAIIAWHKSFSKNIPALPANWAECNGQQITDKTSPLYGLTLPNLNNSITSPGANRFLRGNTTSGTTGGALTHTHPTVNQLVASGTAVTMVQGLQTANHEPPYMDVVWIMRIK
jgi:hypothetical protein